jgi:hypothetical protein
MTLSREWMESSDLQSANQSWQCEVPVQQTKRVRTCKLIDGFFVQCPVSYATMGRVRVWGSAPQSFLPREGFQCEIRATEMSSNFRVCLGLGCGSLRSNREIQGGVGFLRGCARVHDSGRWI